MSFADDINQSTSRNKRQFFITLKKIADKIEKNLSKMPTITNFLSKKYNFTPKLRLDSIYLKKCICTESVLQTFK